MKVWTRQSLIAWEQLEKDGVLKTKRRHALDKYGDCRDIFMLCYDWLVKEASARIAKPEGAEGPLWLALRPDFLPCPASCTLVLELEMAPENMLVFDMGKWDYILNYWYIPLNEADRLEFRKELDKNGVRNQSEVMMTHFYPILRRRMMESWSRLFDEEVRLSENNQAICWEIRKEWVLSVDGEPVEGREKRKNSGK